MKGHLRGNSVPITIDDDGWVERKPQYRAKHMPPLARKGMERHRNRRFPLKAEIEAEIEADLAKREAHLAEMKAKIADRRENLELAALITKVALDE